MINSVLKELPKSTTEISVTIEWSDVKLNYEKILNNVLTQVEIKGFRKGKAPKKIAEKSIDKSKIYEEVIKEIIPKIYQDTISKNNLKPVSSPKIELIKAKENEDWQIKITLSEKPKINLKNYQAKIREAKKAKVKIWTPGQKEEKKDIPSKISVEEIIEAFVKEIDIEISDLLIEQETNRLLTNLLDQIQKLGLTVDQYLISKGKTQNQLKEDYQKQALKNLAIEFSLAEIAEKENITVEKKDIDDLLAKVENPAEKEKLGKESYYLAHLIRQQKTLDFLSNL